MSGAGAGCRGWCWRWRGRRVRWCCSRRRRRRRYFWRRWRRSWGWRTCGSWRSGRGWWGGGGWGGGGAGGGVRGGGGVGFLVGGGLPRGGLGGGGELREACDVAVARGVGAMDFLVEWCLPLVKKGGRMLAMKGARIVEELPAAQKVIKLLGGGESVVHPVDLPGTEHHVV